MQSIKAAGLLLNKLGLHGMQLGLSGMKLESDNADFYIQLINLLQKEMEYKKSRSLNYRLKLAKLPQVKLLADTKAADLVATIDIAEVINHKENLFFIGGSGSAKTHLAIGLAYNALDLGKRIKFYTLANLARDLLLAQQYNNEWRLISRLQKFDILIIDELGYVPIDKKAGILLFELFAKLYEQTSLFITTHLKFDEWNDLFGDLKATKAIIDRLTHHCHVIETGNISYRMKGGTEIH
jgi:DNA replication protein DnaC